MTTPSVSHLITPGSTLFSLMTRHKGSLMTVATSAGVVQGILTAFDPAYLTLVTDTNQTKYVLVMNIASFTFEPAY
ncbi:DUF2642 domain-containing protein [Paenibacillus glycanilyticus]|uniref:DUF2642 domain-containing protein n=1 Tax=Paenibacillus glycanilyticus TaxID=126569 RepID=UPI00203D5206|nr:DUF2642 domain-containing protein [Paenibacillus glycanilyticus]MCM3629532.1 DUF2642 domain-containing protein [Paenibacillus glycanilyticus]